jgi:hypothetical protein
VDDFNLYPELRPVTQPKLDENGKQVYDKDGKPVYEPKLQPVYQPKLDENNEPVYKLKGYKNVYAINKEILHVTPDKLDENLLFRYLYSILEADRVHNEKSKSFIIGQYLFLSSVVSVLVLLAFTLLGISGGLPPFMLQNTNGVPIPNAGQDLIVSENTTVMLNASASSDPDGNIESYLWKQISGPDVNLSGYTDIMPTFVAPDVNNTEDLMFNLTVTDNQNQNASDIVNIRIENDTNVRLDCTIAAAGFQHNMETRTLFVTANPEEVQEYLRCTEVKRGHYMEKDRPIEWFV